MNETRTTDNSNIDLPGYSHIASHRTKHGTKGRHSGGIVIYYKTELSKYVSLVRNEHKDILWIKFNNSMFNNSSDLYIAIIYFSPNNSSRQDHIDNDLFTLLENDVASFMEKSPNVIILGDFNARTALRPDYITYDSSNVNSDIPLPDDYQYDDMSLIPKRCSMDNTTNNHGNKLLNLCKATSLKIVNGRLGNDKLTGAYTCHAPQGSSVVDYMLTPISMFSNIHTFSVLPLTEHSIHCPLTFSIEANLVDNHKHVNVGQLQSGPGTEDYMFRWDSEKCSDYVSNFQLPTCQSNLQKIEELLNDRNLATEECVNEAVSLLMGTIASAALPMKIMLKGQRNQCSRKKTFLPPWNTHKCDEKRKAFKQKRNCYVKSKSETDRIDMVNARSEYCKTARLAKKEHICLQSEKLNQSTNNSKQLWKLLRSSTEKTRDCPISCDMFKTHFEKLASAKTDSAPNDDHNHPVINVEELDLLICEDEVLYAISRLKTGKAAGPDRLGNEFIIKAKGILLPYLVKIFNVIFSTGIFPKEWSKGTIIPIFKKGNKMDPNNYRSITLNNSVAKLYTSVINNILL
jgi:hypothetical protein